MKILLGYSWFKNDYFCIKTHWESWLERLRGHGFDVHGFCLTLHPPGGRLRWSELNSAWLLRDNDLLQKYDELLAALNNCDVFINYNGINVHPDMVTTIRKLGITTVYCCFDDPENSADLSMPVAAAYDLCMVGNIASVDDYHSWGVKHAEFWPIGFRVNEYDSTLTKEIILTGKRHIDMTLLCERQSQWRRHRLDMLVNNFPQMQCYGYGWPNGCLSEIKKVPIYLNTKIGPNLHNSTGPINFRTYTLPACGVLQICDNARYLSQIYELNKEVVGFDTIEECIDACRYYIAHDNERKEIAAAGWERTMRDYNEKTLFQKMINTIVEVKAITCAE